jgi:hypothetical protein
MANVAPYTVGASAVYVGTVPKGGSIEIQNTGATTCFAGTCPVGATPNLTSANGLAIAQNMSVGETNAADAHDWYVISPNGSTTVVVAA